MKKRVFRIVASFMLFFIFAAPSYSKNVYILCYHAFLDKKDPYSITVDQFRDQLNKLKNSGFTFVAFEDVINDKVTGNKNILISIDDGNHSVYQTYYSVLKPMGIRPILGIYPAIIGRVKYAMNWDQVKQLSDEGCYIASHGYHHMFLSQKYYNEDPVSFKKEIYLSKKILEEKLNRKIETMLYPFGVNSEIALSELKNAGYKYGMTIDQGVTPLPVRDNFQIHRYLMTKPGLKSVIANIIRHADTASKDTALQNSRETDLTLTSDGSIFNYPERINKFLTGALELNLKNPPEKTISVKHKDVKQKSRKNSASINKNKIAAKTEKKAQKKKKAV
ncbi:MAG: hypothetical protein CVV49_01275 [Spirochaetae bacterium HGW-Spirochaetae-5]|nr:MAG: hypothetical protein CVV49_01275 [Spirochaetae bacterium HGW-Spirochaetae-5]